MFTGRYYHTLDAKARVAIPSEFRRELLAGDEPEESEAEGAPQRGGKASPTLGSVVLTHGWVAGGYRCLELLPVKTFRERARQWQRWLSDPLDPFQETEAERIRREWLRAEFLHPARRLPVDLQGRILIPVQHRRHAGLDRDVVFTGDYDKVRLWSAEEYARFLRRNEGAGAPSIDASDRGT